MVYIQPRTQAKDSEAVYIQSKYRLRTWKDYKSLQKTKTDFVSLQTLLEDSRDHGKLQSSSTSYGLD